MRRPLPAQLVKGGAFLFGIIFYVPMNTIWNNLPDPFFALAPMEAVTDVVFRHVVARAGRPDVFFTEFTNATGWVHAGKQAIGGRLLKMPGESPIIAQIWGGQPGDMQALAAYCAELGYDGIDINMGCPAKSAIKSGGSALITKPDIAVAAIKAAKTAGLPVSVKTRLGYSRVAEWQDWLTVLLHQDLAALTIHLRTKKEMSKVPAHFELIPDIVTLKNTIAPHTKLIINGDIIDRTHGERLASQYGIDGIMIGRGVFQNPFCFASQHEQPQNKQQALLELLQYHLTQYETYSTETNRPYETLKRFFKVYVRDFDGAHELRTTLMQTSSIAEARHILLTIYKTTAM